MKNNKISIKTITCFLFLTLFSTAYAAEYGVRLGYSEVKHGCGFSNTGNFGAGLVVTGTVKTKDCGEDNSPSIGLVMINKLDNGFFVDSEIAYVTDKTNFKSTYTVNFDVEDAAPGNTQKIIVDSFPRLLVSIGKNFDTGGFIISPVVGVGYAQIKASGIQNEGTVGVFRMRENTNDNFIWNIGASFSVPKSNWSVDYRYIDYGTVETANTQHPSSSTAGERLHGDMTSHNVSLTYKF